MIKKKIYDIFFDFKTGERKTFSRFKMWVYALFMAFIAGTMFGNGIEFIRAGDFGIGFGLTLASLFAIITSGSMLLTAIF